MSVSVVVLPDRPTLALSGHVKDCKVYSPSRKLLHGVADGRNDLLSLRRLRFEKVDKSRLA